MAKPEEQASTTINVGENVAYSVTGDILNITVNLKHRGGKSASGKSISIASTRGNVRVTDDATFGLNVYAKV